MNESTVDVSLADTDPAAFVLAVADLRERRLNDAKGVTGDGRWFMYLGAEYEVHAPHERVCAAISEEVAEHIAAEANPAHALAEVALWRGVVERHGAVFYNADVEPYFVGCKADSLTFPCPDLLAVVTAAKAYLTGDTP